MNKSILLFSVIVLASCNMLMPTYAYKKSMARATAQKWVAGVKDGGRGITFRVLFYDLDELNADTLWINDFPLSTEITKVGDTTYVSSFIHVTGDRPNQPLIKDEQFSGELQIYVKDKKKKLPISSFQNLEPTMYP